jgi:hypothetical protein
MRKAMSQDSTMVHDSRLLHKHCTIWQALLGLLDLTQEEPQQNQPVPVCLGTLSKRREGQSTWEGASATGMFAAHKSRLRVCYLMPQLGYVLVACHPAFGLFPFRSDTPIAL